MPLPDLCLLPHEAGDLAPDEPLCAPATARIRRWKLRSGGSYLLRPAKMTEFPTEWIARRQFFAESPLLRLFWPPDGNLNQVVSQFKTGHFTRVLYFDERIRLITAPREWKYALYFSSQGVPVWHSRSGEKSAFAWSETAARLSEIWRLTVVDSVVQNELTQMLTNSNSDCACALQWLNLSRREKDMQIYLVRRGTLDEFEALLRIIFWSENEDCEASPKTWILYFSTPTLKESFDENTPLESLLLCDRIEILPSARHKILLEMVRREFGLHYNLDLVKRRSGLSQLAWSDYVHNVEIPIPTAHEQLEARLHLRDFLRDKVSPDELAELMGQ